MTLLGLYNLKLNEYKTTGLRERPWKLLAMLLLSEKDKFEPLRASQGEFYAKYKMEIDKCIAKVEQDFNFTHEDIVRYIERTVDCDDYEEQKVWFVFAEGFSALNWGLLYKPEKTGEEIYSDCFDVDDLRKTYDIEQKAIASSITMTQLHDLLNQIFESPTEFFQKICDRLTPEERMFILQNLENKDCTTCLNGSCRVESCEKGGIDEFGEPEGTGCLGWYNAEFIGRCRVLKITDVKKLK